MIHITSSYHRKSVDSAWFTPDPDFAAYRKEKYQNTGKMKNITTLETDDKLTLIILTTFSDKVVLEEFENDDKCKDNMLKRKVYNSSNNIIKDESINREE